MVNLAVLPSSLLSFASEVEIVIENLLSTALDVPVLRRDISAVGLKGFFDSI